MQYQGEIENAPPQVQNASDVSSLEIVLQKKYCKALEIKKFDANLVIGDEQMADADAELFKV